MHPLLISFVQAPACRSGRERERSIQIIAKKIGTIYSVNQVNYNWISN